MCVCVRVYCFLCAQGSRDNMSVIIVTFPGCAEPTAEAIEADADLNRKLVEIVKGCYCYRTCFGRVAAASAGRGGYARNRF